MTTGLWLPPEVAFMEASSDKATYNKITHFLVRILMKAKNGCLLPTRKGCVDTVLLFPESKTSAIYVD